MKSTILVFTLLLATTSYGLHEKHDLPTLAPVRTVEIERWRYNEEPRHKQFELMSIHTEYAEDTSPRLIAHGYWPDQEIPEEKTGILYNGVTNSILRWNRINPDSSLNCEHEEITTQTPDDASILAWPDYECDKLVVTENVGCDSPLLVEGSLCTNYQFSECTIGYTEFSSTYSEHLGIVTKFAWWYSSHGARHIFDYWQAVALEYEVEDYTVFDTTPCGS